MRTMADDVRATARLTSSQIDALDTLTGYERGEIDPATIIPARTLTALVRRGYVDAAGITGVGADTLNAYI